MDLGINKILKPATMTSWDDKDFICLLNYLTFDIMYSAVKCFTCSPPYSTGLCICRLQIVDFFLIQKSKSKPGFWRIKSQQELKVRQGVGVLTLKYF